MWPLRLTAALSQQELAQKVGFELIYWIFNCIKPSILRPILNIWAKPPAGEGSGESESSKGRAVQHGGVDFARNELAIA